jgi:uncharacterized protein YjbJ (UPF0337 family)
MKSGMTGQEEDMFHEQNDNVMEVAGEPGFNQVLAVEGAEENTAGKVQEKFSQFKKVFGK